MAHAAAATSKYPDIDDVLILVCLICKHACGSPGLARHRIGRGQGGKVEREGERAIRARFDKGLSPWDEKNHHGRSLKDDEDEGVEKED